MADQIKQIKEFPNKTDFGDDDLLLLQGQGTTYNVQGRAVKRYAVAAAAEEAGAAAESAAASEASAVRSETAVEHPPVIDYQTGMWQVWDRTAEAYVATTWRAVGKNFEIKGYYSSQEALETAVPSPAPGDAYGVGAEAPYDIYVWDAVGGQWKNNGPLTASGDMMKSTYDPQRKETDVFAYADAAHVGKSMAGQTVEPTQGTTVTAENGAEVFNNYSTRTYGTEEGSETVVPKNGNVASGRFSHAEGSLTTATGFAAHAEGQTSTASGDNSHTEGIMTTASGTASHAEGGYFTGDVGNIASGYGSHAEGVSTKASGSGAHAEGRGTKAEGKGAHSEGQSTTASKDGSHAEGYSTTAGGINAHAEGNVTQAMGQDAHAEGVFGIAEGPASHVEGGKMTNNVANKASGYAAHAEGASTLASGNQSHAECEITTASGKASHAEGIRGVASGNASHVEGGYVNGHEPNKASNYADHAEGASTEASGGSCHAEGELTIASGYCSHAAGYRTKSLAPYSCSGGQDTISEYYAETAIGRWNVKKNPDEYTYAGDLFVIGKGTSEDARSNVFRVNHGGVYGTSSFNASGADYAELFEWADGNPDHVDRVGRFVTLDGAKIRLAGPGEGYILGIVSGAPSVVGDVYDDQWQGMYLTDVFGRPVWEDVEVPEVTETFPDPENPENTVTRVIIPAHTERRQKLNPAYDTSQLPYIPRTERPEWAAVGLLGKLVALEDGSCEVNGYCAVGEGGVATASQTRTAYRVMEKLTDPETGAKCVRVMILPEGRR